MFKGQAILPHWLRQHWCGPLVQGETCGVTAGAYAQAALVIGGLPATGIIPSKDHKRHLTHARPARSWRGVRAYLPAALQASPLHESSKPSLPSFATRHEGKCCCLVHLHLHGVTPPAAWLLQLQLALLLFRQRRVMLRACPPYSSLPPLAAVPLPSVWFVSTPFTCNPWHVPP